MQVIVTGAGGFVGPHLIQHIQDVEPQANIYGCTRLLQENLIRDVAYQQIDLKDYDAVHDWIAAIQPDLIYHLAGQSSPSKALNAVWETIETNIRIQLNIFQACIDLNIKPRIITISSGEIYTGGISDPATMPVNETAELRPSNPYALSKATQDLMGLQYFLSHQLPIIRVRPFNHTGPHQRASFVAPDFALQIAKIEVGLQSPLMRVGNLQAQRDFTDVRDVVRAYVLLSQLGKAGETYNVSSNKTYSIQALLDTLLSFTDSDITVEIDPKRFRPVDVPVVQGDNTRLVALTGWQPTINFEQTLHDLLQDCRERVKIMMRSNN